MKELLSLGLFYLEFQDAIREGDGLRFMFVWFRSTGNTNYTIEAMTLLVQYYFLFTPRLAEQLIWGRFINAHGGLGRNIPVGLHMERLNRICKQAVAHLGANKTPPIHIKDQPGKSIYIFATLLPSLSSLDMLFSACVLPTGVCKIAIHLYTL